MRKVFVFINILGIVLMMVLGSVCAKQKPAPSLSTASEKIPVVVQTVIPEDLIESISLIGTIEPSSEIKIFSKIAGRIESLHADKGQKVKAGDKLTVLEHSAISAQVAQAEASLKVFQAQLKQVEVNLENLKKELGRIRSLAQEGAVSKQLLDQTETQYQSTQAQDGLVRAQIEQTEAVLRQAQIQEKEAYLIAPIDGIIAERFLEIGDMASPAQPVFRIVQMDNVKIISALPEEEISRVQAGKTETEIRVDTYPKERFQGKVAKIAPTLDPKSRTVEIEISLPNPELKLKPGMFSRIELMIEAYHDIVAVPRDLLVREGDKYFVYVAEHNYARKRAVTLGVQAHGLVEIKNGLAPDERIITTIGPHLYDGCAIVTTD